MDLRLHRDHYRLVTNNNLSYSTDGWTDATLGSGISGYVRYKIIGHIVLLKYNVVPSTTTSVIFAKGLPYTKNMFSPIFVRQSNNGNWLVAQIDSSAQFKLNVTDGAETTYGYSGTAMYCLG